MEKMYAERKGNIAAFRGCRYNCYYCAFQKMLKLSKCQKCRDFEPHSHLEVLQRTPPKTKQGEFLTIGLSGDVSFMYWREMLGVFEFCNKWPDRTFLIQTKNPGIFLLHDGNIPKNLIVGTTIESNRLVSAGNSCYFERYDHGFEPISQAPSAKQRYEGMLSFDGRKAIIIEPVMGFDIDVLASWVYTINPEIVWVGYDSHPKKNMLTEPSLYKVDSFVGRLRDKGINVRLKFIREPVLEKKKKSGELK